MPAEGDASLRGQWIERIGAGQQLTAKTLDLLPELRDALGQGRLTVHPSEGSVVEAEGDNDLALHLEAKLVPDGVDPQSSDRQYVGFVDLDIYTDDGVIRIDTLDTPGAVHGLGFGRLVIGALAILGDQLALDRIELEAGKVGRWAWLQCGFDFMLDDDRDRVVSAATEFAVTLGRPVELKIEHSWDFADQPELKVSVPVTDVIAAGGPMIEPSDGSVTLGKALILGPPLDSNTWFGVLNLDRRSEGRVRLDSYALG